MKAKIISNSDSAAALEAAAKRFLHEARTTDDFVPEALAFVTSRVRSNLRRFRPGSPSATENGRYIFAEDGNWIGGFWSGILNLTYEITKDTTFHQAARESTRPYLARLRSQPETLDHDIGFLVIPSFVADYKLSGEMAAWKQALQAAEFLAARFNKAGQFLQCWNVWLPLRPFSIENRGRIIADSLYNIPLLYWAARETGEVRFATVASAHAHTSLRHLVRADYSTFHTFVFDPDSGAPKYGQTHQGYADDSWWARGQSWVIGGYAHAYRYTGDTAFLAAARKLAAAYLEAVEDDSIPRWDFRVPDPSSHPLDSSSAAITACGLLEIARNDPETRGVCEAVGRHIVRQLWTHYSTRDNPDEEGLLRHGCGHYPMGMGLDCSLIYGDYYFLEALTRLAGISRGYW